MKSFKCESGRSGRIARGFTDCLLIDENSDPGTVWQIAHLPLNGLAGASVVSRFYVSNVCVEAALTRHRGWILVAIASGCFAALTPLDVAKRLASPFGRMSAIHCEHGRLAEPLSLVNMGSSLRVTASTNDNVYGLARSCGFHSRRARLDSGSGACACCRRSFGESAH